MNVITGEKLVNFLVEPKKGAKWPKNLPQFENRHDVIAVCKDLCKQTFLLRSEKRGKGELGVSFSNKVIKMVFNLLLLTDCIFS
jgi:translocation protein SEC62